MSPLLDIQRRTARLFRLELLSHGNQKKTARILWSLEGRMENGLIHLKRNDDWNIAFVDEASNFPSALVHDDMLDALSYVDQLVTLPYMMGDEEMDEWEPLDAVAGY
jgi:phage terminase large subunit-like protein